MLALRAKKQPAVHTPWSLRTSARRRPVVQLGKRDVPDRVRRAKMRLCGRESEPVARGMSVCDGRSGRSLRWRCGRRARQSAVRVGVRVLSAFALVATGATAFFGVLAAGYTHEGDSPFYSGGAIAQLAVALVGLALAIAARTSLTDHHTRRSLILALLALALAVGWYPVLMAVWEG